MDQRFDRTVFPVVPLGSYRFGSSGRNILDGPGAININTSLSRRLRFQENRSLQSPNHPNFNLPENKVDIMGGGSIGRAKTNRVLQLALRLEF